MYCKSCGKAVVIGGKYCKNCGAIIPTPQIPLLKVSPVKKIKKGYNAPLIGFGILLLVIVAVYYAYSVFEKSKNTNLESPNLIISSVVNIFCDNKNGGSGTIWLEDGTIVTNYHVIAGSKSCFITIPEIETGAPAEIYEARPYIVPELSKQYDIAILNIYSAYKDSNGKTWGVYPKTFYAYFDAGGCKNMNPKLGDEIRIYGYPVTSGGLNLTITDGVISSFSEDGNILTSAKVDSGNSGGLAIDQNRCMIGIPSAVLTGNYQNLGAIIPISIISDFLSKTQKHQ